MIIRKTCNFKDFLMALEAWDPSGAGRTLEKADYISTLMDTFDIFIIVKYA